MSLKYTLGSILAAPLLPIMYYQGKRIRASVPQLPEAEGVEGTAEHPSGKEISILCLGESTIAGVGVKTHAEGFSGTFAKTFSQLKETSVHWRVYARSGYTVKRLTYKIIPKIEQSHADLIVIGLGGNDAFTLNSPNKWKASIELLIKAIRGKFGNVPIAFLNMPPIKEFPAFTPLIKFVVGNLVEILGETLNEVVQQHDNIFYHSEVIEMETWAKRHQVEASPEHFFSDGVHPSLLTYQVWAKDFAQFLSGQSKLNEYFRRVKH